MNLPWPLGIVPSLNTPFTADDALDLDAVDRLVRSIAADGCTGALVLAVAGEGEALDESEARSLLQQAVKTAELLGDHFPIIASLGPDAGLARRRAELYAADGADMLLYQAPPGQSGEILEDTLRLLASAGRPIMLQDFDPDGPGLETSELVRLAGTIPGVRYVKVETRPSGPKMSALLRSGKGRIHVSGGWAVNEMLDALSRGIHAFIPTELELVYVEIVRAHNRGDPTSAAEHFARISPVLAFANRDVGTSIRFLKQLRFRRGLFRTDRCRDPVPEFDRSTQAEADLLIDCAIDAIEACRR